MQLKSSLLRWPVSTKVIVTGLVLARLSSVAMGRLLGRLLEQFFAVRPDCLGRSSSLCLRVDTRVVETFLAAWGLLLVRERLREQSLILRILHSYWVRVPIVDGLIDIVRLGLVKLEVIVLVQEVLLERHSADISCRTEILQILKHTELRLTCEWLWGRLLNPSLAALIRRGEVLHAVRCASMRSLLLNLVNEILIVIQIGVNAV